MDFYQECGSLGGWVSMEVPSHTDPKIFYLVTIPPWDRDQPESISCECQSYEFRGRCRHQIEAIALICHWDDLTGKDQEEYNICPECGSQTRFVIMDDNGS